MIKYFVIIAALLSSHVLASSVSVVEFLQGKYLGQPVEYYEWLTPKQVKKLKKKKVKAVGKIKKDFVKEIIVSEDGYAIKMKKGPVVDVLFIETFERDDTVTALSQQKNHEIRLKAESFISSSINPILGGGSQQISSGFNIDSLKNMMPNQSNNFDSTQEIVYTDYSLSRKMKGYAYITPSGLVLKNGQKLLVRFVLFSKGK